MDTILLISRVEVIFAAVLSVVAVTLYAIYSPAWRKTFFGKTLFSVLGMFSFSLVVAAITIIFGLSPWTIVLRVVGYFMLVVAMGILCVAIVIIQERAFLKHKADMEARYGKVDSKPEGA